MGLKTLGREVLNNNLYLNNMYYSTMLLSKWRMKKQIRICEKIDSIEDTAGLQAFRRSFSEEKPFAPARNLEYSLMRMYGYWDSIFGRLPDKNTLHYPTIEHGMIFDRLICPEVDRMVRPSCITFGEYRKEIIHRHKEGMPVFCVGPYLHYTVPYYSEEKMRQVKEELGRTLLIFPAHSIPKTFVSRNTEKYMDTIHSIAKDFDSVLVNLYWWDLNWDTVSAYEREGFNVVSAGFPYDINFARRLKTVIQLSDMAIGDSIGTHVGYCVEEKVPFRYLSVGTEEEGLFGNDIEDWDYAQRVIASIAAVFADTTKITQVQVDAIDNYWGLSKIRTPEEIQNIYEINYKLTRLAKGTPKGYRKAVDTLLAQYANGEKEKYRLLMEALE